MSKLTLLIAVLALGTQFLVVAPGEAQDGAPVEIVYGTFLSPESTDPRAAAQTQQIEEFEQRYPNIKVKLLVDPSFQNIVRAAKAGLETPDVYRAMDPIFPEIVAAGNVEPLDQYMARDGVSLEDFLTAPEAVKFDGKVMGLVQDYRIPVLLYRKSLLTGAGITELPETYEEVCEVGAKISNGPIVGFVMPLGSSGAVAGAQSLVENILPTILAGDTGQFFKEDRRTIGFTRDALLNAATLIKNHFLKCKASPLTAAQFGFNETHDGLRAGTVAMANFGFHRFRAIKVNGAGDDLGWAPSVKPKGVTKQSIFSFNLVLNANSKHKEEAWTFLRFLVSEDANIINAKSGEVVALRAAYVDPYFETEQGRQQAQLAKLIESSGRDVYWSIISTTFNEIIGNAFLRMVLEDGSPEDAADEIITRYNEAIGKAP